MIKGYCTNCKETEIVRRQEKEECLYCRRIEVYKSKDDKKKHMEGKLTPDEKYWGNKDLYEVPPKDKVFTIEITAAPSQVIHGDRLQKEMGCKEVISAEEKKAEIRATRKLCEDMAEDKYLIVQSVKESKDFEEYLKKLQNHNKRTL
jgi:hypothetical protein